MDQVTSADGTTLAVSQSGTRPALVMIDPAGGFSGFRPMGEAAELLSEHFHVTTYDRRGRGQSGDTQPFAVHREVEDIAAIINYVGEPVTLYGFSSGAALALHAAASSVEIDRVVLFEPAVDLDQEPDIELATELERLIGNDHRGAAVEFFNRSIGVPEEWVSALRDHPAWPGLEALAHTLLYDIAISDATTRDLLSDVTVPVTVLASSGSDTSLQQWAEDVANVVQRGTFERIEGEWHGVSPEALATAIKDATG